MGDETQAWMESGKYLPEPLRDFHDQKDVFKAMHEIINKNQTAEAVGWVDGQIYTIDVFLWFMARRGWTMQRSRKNLPFRDLDADVAEANRHRVERLNELIKQQIGCTSSPNTEGKD